MVQGKRRTKSTQLSIFPFAPIKQMRGKDVVIASGSPHDDRYAEKPPEKHSPVWPAEKRRLRR
jgi:hypothetical protein